MAEINKDNTNLNSPTSPKDNSIAPPPVKPVPPSPPVKPAPPPPLLPPLKPVPPTPKPKVPGLSVKPSTNPEEVKLPEKGTPELSGGKPVAPKLKPAAKGGKSQQAPVIETGPIEKNSPKKIGKYIGIAVISIIILGGILYGYMLIRNMPIADDVVEEPDVQETTESVVIEQPKEDITSLKYLENKYGDIEDELVVLERGASFGREANVTSPDF